MSFEEPHSYQYQNVYDIDSVGKERARGLERERGKVMGVAIFAGKWGIGPGNVLATLREEVREVRDLVRAGRGQAKLGMVEVVMLKVLGTKVHVSTASKLDTKQQSA